ncbi:30S ribosomal protein S1 [Novipirellula aureliae]|uniref:30S ribosomal protein S1 n=1 Tax=Novipirellula aureliae TaxID=2527966 RepID=A0A5C6DK02_9BACT|nr:S1 RNA-binding domain-containing protein [Novipirellula aureliae]TWU35256.1 30S ribosomal protein S1 [Novipirellula aureliae]
MTNGETPQTDSTTAGPHPSSEPQNSVEKPLQEPVQSEGSPASQPAADVPVSPPPESAAGETPSHPSGPLAAVARSGAGPLAARGLGVAKPASPSVSTAKLSDPTKSDSKDKKTAKKKKGPPRPRLKGEADSTGQPKPKPAQPSKVAVPNLRDSLSDDLQAELDAELAAADVDAMLGGMAGMSARKEPLAEGARVQAKVLKINEDSVFVALGGPDEGVIPFEQFTEAEPKPGDDVEVLVRGLNKADGLYVLTLPGSAIEVSDWDDIEEGSIVEATVTGHNTGGLECTVGSVRAFMPISQVTEYRVEDLSEFVDQKMVCLVTEANERRGNLVLSRRAILERERETRRKEQMEQIEVGDTLEGVVRTVKDFGAFVDLGGVEGLIHISKLSWDRVKHPSEVMEEGQRVRVKIDKIDKDSGKISLSYRDLLENPWDAAESSFAVGTVQKGTITRIAPFGCFVRLGAGIEGLVHISELANHRVSKVDAFVSEGEEVEVKVLSFDRDTQKIGLSIKAAQTLAAAASAGEASKEADEADEPPRELAVKASHQGPLKGGNNTDTGGERFGLRW